MFVCEWQRSSLDGISLSLFILISGDRVSHWPGIHQSDYTSWPGSPKDPSPYVSPASGLLALPKFFLNRSLRDQTQILSLSRKTLC